MNKYFPTTTIKGTFLSSCQCTTESILSLIWTVPNASILHPAAGRLKVKYPWQMSEAKEDRVGAETQVRRQQTQATTSSHRVPGCLRAAARTVLASHILRTALFWKWCHAICLDEGKFRVEYKILVFSQDCTDLQHTPTPAVRQTVTSLTLQIMMFWEIFVCTLVWHLPVKAWVHKIRWNDITYCCES